MRRYAMSAGAAGSNILFDRRACPLPDRSPAEAGTLSETDRSGAPRGPLGRVAVIIPTYNERENLESIAARVRSAVPAADVLVFDDNSPDATGELADKLAAGDQQIHVLHRPGKAGLGAAYIAGVGWGAGAGLSAVGGGGARGAPPAE